MPIQRAVHSLALTTSLASAACQHTVGREQEAGHKVLVLLNVLSLACATQGWGGGWGGVGASERTR